TAGAADGLVPIVPNPPGGAASVGFSPAFYTAQDRTNWMATATGRLGYAWDRTLLYVKGGIAFEDSSTTVNCIFGPGGSLGVGVAINPKFCNNPAGVNVAAFSTPWYTRVGGVIGFGSEFDLGHNWSAKSEYNLMGFDRHTATASDGTVMTDKSWISQV